MIKQWHATAKWQFSIGVWWVQFLRLIARWILLNAHLIWWIREIYKKGTIFVFVDGRKGRLTLFITLISFGPFNFEWKVLVSKKSLEFGISIGNTHQENRVYSVSYTVYLWYETDTMHYFLIKNLSLVFIFYLYKVNQIQAFFLVLEVSYIG